MFFKKNKNAKKEKGNIFLHESYPDILFWKLGDKFYWPDNVSHELLGMKDNGDCLMGWCGDIDRIKIVHVRDLYGYNDSLKERRRSKRREELTIEFNSGEYLQYIKDFNKAYREIKRGSDELLKENYAEG